MRSEVLYLNQLVARLESWSDWAESNFWWEGLIPSMKSRIIELVRQLNQVFRIQLFFPAYEVVSCRSFVLTTWLVNRGLKPRPGERYFLHRDVLAEFSTVLFEDNPRIEKQIEDLWNKLP